MLQVYSGMLQTRAMMYKYQEPPDKTSPHLFVLDGVNIFGTITLAKKY
jgi:hypothetical protein